MNKVRILENHVLSFHMQLKTTVQIVVVWPWLHLDVSAQPGCALVVVGLYTSP